MLFFKTICTVIHLKSNALQTLIWHSWVMHLMTFNFAANDTLYLCISKVAFFTLLIHQESVEKINCSTLNTQDKTSFITHHLKNESKLWLDTSLISHSFLLQRRGNCSTQFHKLLVLTCCTQLLWVYAQIELQVLRYTFKRVSFLQNVQKLKRSGEGHNSFIAKQHLVKHTI
jgi:hypothetical protein